MIEWLHSFSPFRIGIVQVLSIIPPAVSNRLQLTFVHYGFTSTNQPMNSLVYQRSQNGEQCIFIKITGTTYFSFKSFALLYTVNGKAANSNLVTKTSQRLEILVKTD